MWRCTVIVQETNRTNEVFIDELNGNQMDFSGLISQEIERKKEAVKSKKKKKVKSGHGTEKTVKSTIGDEENIDQSKLPVINENFQFKSKNESISNTNSSHELAEQVVGNEIVEENPKGEDLNDVITREENQKNFDGSSNHIALTEEEIKLSETISVDDIDAKLKEFNETTQGSKEAKIRKLGILLRHQKRDFLFQKQLQLEEKVNVQLNSEDLDQLNEEIIVKLSLQLRKYIKLLLNEWGVLASTDQEKKLLYETKKDVIVLLNRLRKQKLKKNMLISLTTVLYHLQKKEYSKANESYMKLSIGNTAWPIGVRSVGIHERAADSKITGDDKQNSANIMINDSTRRWITGIKRIITFFERHS